MKSNTNIKTPIYLKKSLILFVFGLYCHFIQAQAPYINNIDKTRASIGETVTITGLNLPTTLGNAVVFFGSVRGEVLSTSENLIEVKVPAGATSDNISVLDLSNNLIAFSNEIFSISYGGGAFESTDLDTGSDQFRRATDQMVTFDLCLCDFNNDGLSDVAVTNNDGDADKVNILTNNSNTTTESYSDDPLDINLPSVNVSCGDLDGDGLADLLVSRGGGNSNSFIIFRNTTSGATISFDEPGQTITLPDTDGGAIRSPREVLIQDIDLDGKPDLTIGNETDNIIDIFKNTSSIGSITFANSNTPVQIEATGSLISSNVDVKDLNNDGLPEIMVLNEGQRDLFVFQNSSEPDAISFLDVNQISVNGNFRSVKAGDLNNDGFSDIVISNNVGSQILIFENSTPSVGGTVTFDTPITINNITSPWGIEVGDINGDGLLDIAVGSTGTSSPALYLLVNTDAASLAFDTNAISLSNNSRYVKIADLNGDGKPDLGFTHNSGDGLNGEYSVITNRQCIFPEITPNTDIVICQGLTTRIETTGSAGATYLWDRADIGSSSFSNVETGTNNFLDVTTEGRYRVTVLSDANSCSNSSNVIEVTIDNTVFITDPVASSSVEGTVVCPGGATSITLTSTSAGTGANYTWTGPNGFSSTDQNPMLSDLTPEMSGLYIVYADTLITSGPNTGGRCRSTADTTTVVIESLPTIAVNNSGQDVFCVGSSVVVSVTDFGSDYTYQWRRDGSNITDETNTTLTITDAGDYSAVITSVSTTCSQESAARTITTANIPTASFTTSVSEICVDLQVDFDASGSSGDNGFTLDYAWDFGDGNNGTGETTSHTYTSAASVNPSLTVSYQEISTCNNPTVQNTIDVQDPPVVDITSAGGATEKCPSADLRLSIDENFTNIVWSTGATENFIDVSDPGTFTADAVNSVGCAFTTNPFTVSNLANSGITIESSTHTITDGEINLSADDSSVGLSVPNATSPVWEPSDVIDNNLANIITVIPQDIRTEITVEGTDPNGCLEADTVLILNDNIRAKTVFSPNGDGIGDECWEITNSRGDTFTQCTIFIFDSKGKHLLKTTGPFENDCVWDGTHNGTNVPEGIYYYALKCSDSSIDRAGTILLAR